MLYDIFFSVSQTPVAGYMPSEKEMFANFFAQVQAADAMGYETAWLAESHLSSEVQKTNSKPVIPHWQGEVGLNVDMLQMAQRIFACTKNIEVGSAVMNIVCNGGPIAAAERIAYFLALHGMNPEEKRRLHVGFSAGRFDFMNRAAGILARNEVEEAAWPALKGKVFREACEIFLRLLSGETLNSDMIAPTTLKRDDFRSDEDWQKVCSAAGGDRDILDIPKRWVFENIKIIPQDWRRNLLSPIIGSHDPRLQEDVNQWWPVKVFNLSITRSDIIEATHERLTKAFHQDGGAWMREYMPRTVFVFINEEEGLSAEEKRQAAHTEAQEALGAYWTALEGTLDPVKVEKATDNALIGNAEDVAAEAVERFHPDDRLMLWFDFFNHDSKRVIRNMDTFMQKVKPKIEELLRR